MSPDGSLLVYVGTTGLYARDMGTFDPVPVPGTEGGFGPFFSPDGEWLGFFADGELKKRRLSGGPVTTLCDAPSGRGASWGPDDTIVFTPNAGGALSIVSAAGGAPQVLTTADVDNGERWHYWPEFLPGGQAVLFTVGGDERHVAVHSLETGERHVLLEGSNGRYLGTGHLVYNLGGSLLVAPFDRSRLRLTGNPIPVLEGVSVGEFGAAHFAIAGDGTLAYVAGDGVMVRESTLLWVERDGAATPLASPPRPYRNPKVAPDGERIAVSIANQVWIYHAARENWTRLTYERATNQYPLWTPDGKRVTFRSFRESAFNVYWTPVDGSDPEERLTESRNWQTPGSWSPDGRLLAFMETDVTTGKDIWLLPLEGEREPRPFLETEFDEFDDKYLETQERIKSNQQMIQPNASTKPGAAREGKALLQGLGRCGRCGRAMYVSYGGHHSERGRVGRTMQYRCMRARDQKGGSHCQVIGGKRIDDAVVQAFVEATEPAGLQALRSMQEQLQADNDALNRHWELQVEKAEFEAKRAQRQFHVVEPENRLVGRELERRWNVRLVELDKVRQKAEAAKKQTLALSDEDIARAEQLAGHLEEVWNAETTTNRDKKRLLRCLIEEVQLTTEEKRYVIRIIWKGGATTELEVLRRGSGTGHITSPDDIELVRQLAEEFDDAQIARILNKQGRRTGFGNPYTKSNVLSMRGRHKIPKRPKKLVKDPKEGPFTADEASVELGVSMSTIQRWLQEGILAGEQLTPGAPWRILLGDEVRKKLSGGDAPEGWVSLGEAARRLGLSRSHVTYLVKTGKLEAMQTIVRKRRRWRINVESATCGRQEELFEQKTNTIIKEA